MCGIVGVLSLADFAATQKALPKMVKAIHHRGPDGSGEWFDPEAGIALGHARLAIVDLSPEGAQPMVSMNGGLVIAFNGEIYNHQDIRRELDQSVPGINWRGPSDTETLLAAIQCWGLEKALIRSIGMFAIALWDRQTRKLTLARDRLGESRFTMGGRANTFCLAPNWRRCGVTLDFGQKWTPRRSR